MVFRSSREKVSVWVLAWALVLSGAMRAEAKEDLDDGLARQHHELASALYERGEFAAAAREFREAYTLSGRPELLYNVYLSHRDAGEIREATEALRAYLEAVPDVENAALLRARLATYEAQLAREAEAASPVEIGVEAAPVEAPIASPESGVSPVGPIVMAIGGASLIAGLITGGLALDAGARLAQMCGADHLCPSGAMATRDEGFALASATDGLLIGGGIALATGLVLTLVLPGEGSGDVQVAWGLTSVSIEGAF